MRLAFFVPGSPITQGSGSAIVITDRQRSRRRCGCVGQYVPENNNELRAWRKQVANGATWAVKDRGRPGPFKDTAYAIRATFYLARGKTVKREMPFKKPDGDKLMRAIGDALTGIVYEDDGQVTSGTFRKRYGRKTGVYIEITLDAPDENEETLFPAGEAAV